MNRITLALLLCAGAGSGAAAGKPEIPLAPFAPGMSFAEAEAAAPGLVWRAEHVSALTGRTLAKLASDAIVLGGVPHDIVLTPGFHGESTLVLSHYEVADGPLQCQATSVAVLADLESRFGRFKADPPRESTPSGTGYLPAYRTQKTENGIIVVPDPGSLGASFPTYNSLPHDMVKAGKRSRMVFDLVTEPPSRRVGRSEFRSRALHVNVLSYFDPAEFAEMQCLVRTTVTQHGESVRPQEIEIPADRMLSAISTGLKHHSLDGVPLPADGVVLHFNCVPDRRSGGLYCGDPEEETDPALIHAANLRIDGMSFDASWPELDDPATDSLQLAAALNPADRVTFDILATTLTPAEEIRWTGFPGEDVMNRHRAAGSGKVRVACQVQQDLSLVCAALDANGAAIPTESATPAESAAVDILRRYAPAAELASGAPAAGAVFETFVDFGD